MKSRSRLRTVFKVSAGCVILFLLAMVFIYVLHRPSMKVIHQWQQPDAISCNGWGPDYLKVVESDLDWRGFPIHVPRHYFIHVGRDAAKPVYGHVIKFSFYPYLDELDVFLQRSVVTWTDEGVELSLPSGHRLFIPEKMFTGGR